MNQLCIQRNKYNIVRITEYYIICNSQHSVTYVLNDIEICIYLSND